jgi:hypothetical protein
MRDRYGRERGHDFERDPRRDEDERNRGEFSGGPYRELGGYYARDTHRGGYGDEYARDGGWSGGGRGDQYARESLRGATGAYGEPVPPGRPSYRGLGPKNWRPSDERIVESVNEMLADHDEIDATDIEVAAGNGEVTLSGSVNTRREKRLAEDAVAGMRGVRDVHNRLKVSDREMHIGKASE